MENEDEYFEECECRFGECRGSDFCRLDGLGDYADYLNDQRVERELDAFYD